MTHAYWQQAVDILMAEEVIAVNQDDLGVAGDLIWKEGPNEVYVTRSLQPWQRVGVQNSMFVRSNDSAIEHASAGCRCVSAHCLLPGVCWAAEGRLAGRGALQPALARLQVPYMMPDEEARGLAQGAEERQRRDGGAVLTAAVPGCRYNNMTVTWEQLGYSSGESAVVRDMFLQEDLGEYTGDVRMVVRAARQHGHDCSHMLEKLGLCRLTGSNVFRIRLGMCAGVELMARHLYCSGSFTAPVEAHNVLALRITPVEENAERNERWRPWRQQKDELLASTQPQTADWQADDRLSIRTRKPRLLTLQARSVLRRMGFLSQ